MAAWDGTFDPLRPRSSRHPMASRNYMPSFYGAWFPAPMCKPYSCDGEWVWVRMRNGEECVESADAIDWSHRIEDPERDIIAYALRDNHPAYLKHSNADPHNVPAELEENPWFGQF